MKSPLLKYLFKYEEHREKDERIISDIYDGSNWKYFSSLMRPTDYFIGLELSWDGFQPDDNAKSIWPLFYSILNYPPCLRGKIHYGLHLLAIDDGKDPVWDAVVSEFLDLWNHGVNIDGNIYRVAITRVILDGRGLEHLTKTSG
jgi:hypothetical protein